MSMLTLSKTDSREAIPQSMSRRGYLRAKRVLDIGLSLTALIVLLPALLLVAGLLLIVDGRPVFFRQKRVGRDGREFDCLKFRTMRRDADQALQKLLSSCAKSRAEWQERLKLSSDPRIHSIGTLLRYTSFDEAPQLINILRGDMSLVGPRPIVGNEIERYGDNFQIYLAMTPGLTGEWQVRRNPETSYQQRVEFDVDYYRKRSIAYDLRLIAGTVMIVLFARNIG